MNPILYEIPAVLETERLLLRRPESGDGKAVNDAVKASIQELRPWMPFAQRIPTVEDSEINCREAYSSFINRVNLRYLLFHKETNAFIGSSGFHNIDWNVPKCEIGYWIHTTYSGYGYMTEAVNKLTQFALSDLKCQRVEIRCEAKNLKSRAIPEKLEFALEGILRNDDLSADGQHLTDTCIYAKT
ncbi:GNAT family N-acetyltransferase [Sediminibacillus albus]|uniref:Protein N-acetyltransferase, RimJ/RimL family n=1 Tax=Sediminibacillus albus TaxID=407036 RepID=A0A1G8WIV7_9BACI|nr:GNAT family N-acetyltransferase [Sediminibacillus albus]SDJ78244.1 Protein N-acetyltransferase, RimJ/RimL family [Sediminibacillus albus]